MVRQLKCLGIVNVIRINSIIVFIVLQIIRESGEWFLAALLLILINLLRVDTPHWYLIVSSGRFGVWKSISVSSPRYIYKHPEILGDYVAHILPKDFYLNTLFWNKAIHKNNLLGYRILPLGVLPVEDGFFASGGFRSSEFLKGSRVKVFDFRFFELSLLHPGLAVDKRGGSGMVISFVHPAFYSISKNVPVNHFFRDYVRQIKTTGLRDSVISLYLTLIFSDPDMFCYYLPRAVKFVFVDYSVAQAQFLRANSRMFFPVGYWNRMYAVNNRHEPSVHLQTARSFIYRIARKQ